MIQLILAQVNVGVGPSPAGGKVLTCADPQSGITVVLPLEGDLPERLRAALGGVAIAGPADLGALRQNGAGS